MSMIAQTTTPYRPCASYEASQLLSMGRPLNESLDRPKPKISWNLSRGKDSSGPQTAVRPVRLVSCELLWPRARKLARNPDRVMTAIAVIAPAMANSLRTRALATIRLRPATSRAAIIATRAVLARVAIKIIPAADTIIRVTRLGSLPQNQSTAVTPKITAA